MEQEEKEDVEQQQIGFFTHLFARSLARRMQAEQDK